MDWNGNCYDFVWFDTGNPEALAKTRKVYAESQELNILEK